ncbi:hypothetical protein C8D95_11453 [Silicimonas algicola]|uniref:Uncharacterized protein n=2 Tax=Silicimonas algicola TaxID=1826607 RepID=A0A316FWS5_9RHOB|nr:hypothetical protein C8D95_11453 [Silicimonas algicola]
MSIAIDTFQNRSMRMSMVLNVVLALGIVALLPMPQAKGSGARVCADNPGNVTALEVAQVGKMRERAASKVEGPARVIRKAALVSTGGTTTPIVRSVRCLRN